MFTFPILFPIGFDPIDPLDIPENSEQENSEQENSEQENSEQENSEQENSEQENSEQENSEQENSESIDSSHFSPSELQNSDIQDELGFDFIDENPLYSRFKSVYGVGFDFIVQPMLYLEENSIVERNISTDLLSGVALQIESGLRLWEGYDDDSVSWKVFRENAAPSASITLAYRIQQMTSLSEEIQFKDSSFGIGFHTLEESSGLEDFLVVRDGSILYVGTRTLRSDDTKKQWSSSLQIQKEIGRHLLQVQFLGSLYFKNDDHPFGCSFAFGTGWRL